MPLWSAVALSTYYKFKLFYFHQTLDDCAWLYVQAKKKKNDSLRQLTLIHDNEVDWCAVVLVLLLGIASKANVLAAVLESDIPQQDGDVISLVFPNKLYPFSIYGDIWHRVLWLYCRVTHLKTAGNCQGSEEGQGLSRNKRLFTIWMLPLLLNCQLK